MNERHDAYLDHGEDDAIDLRDIVDFLRNEWRKLLAGAMAAMLLSVGGAAVLGGYKANGAVFQVATKDATAFDLVKWKYFQRTLPDLAAELVRSGRLELDREGQFNFLSRPEWWDKNVVPHYAFSKNDSKLLAGANKEFQDTEATRIQYLAVSSTGPSSEEASKNLETTVEFIRSGAAYLELKQLVLEVDASTARADADLRQRLLSAEVEMDYLRQKTANLETLRKRFPNNGVGMAGQVLDPKDTAAKYLPLDTQAVAANADIYALEESLRRMRNAQAQHVLTRSFVEQALPAVQKHLDGPSLGDALLAIIAGLREQLSADDLIRQQALTSLESRIRSILTVFDKGLQVSVEAEPRRVAKFPLLASLGFIGGGMAMLIFVMAGRVLSWPRASR
jgi:hypothetical protein